MLTIIDRYILKSFGYSFLICFAALFGLFIIINVFDHLEQLVNLGFYQMFQFIFRMYMYKIFVISRQIIGPVTLMAGMFTITRLNKNNELVPLKSCGISIYRILMPIFMCSILVALFGYINEEVIIPSIGETLLKIEKVMQGKKLDLKQVFEVRDKMGNTFFCQQYWVIKNSITGLTIHGGRDGKRSYRIYANKGVWKPDIDGVRKWFLSDGNYSLFDEKSEILPGYPQIFEKDGVVIEGPEPRGPSLASRVREDGKFVIISEIAPEDLSREGENIQEYMSASQLRKSMQDLEPPWTLVKYHSHFSAPLASIVLIILGLPFVLRQENVNVFLGVGICIIVCAAYIFIGLVSIEFGNNGKLSPAAAAWFPVLLFGPTGIFLFDWLVKT